MSKIGILLVWSWSTIVTFFSILAFVSSSMLISFFCCVISSIPVFVKFSTIVTCFALIAILIDFVSSSSSSSSVSIPFSCCVISSIGYLILCVWICF